MRLRITGGTGVLGRALQPLAEGAGHQLATPGREELDLFDPSVVLSALSLPSGTYNVCRDREGVSAERFTRAAGWHPTA
jgi:hypothetical protein